MMQWNIPANTISTYSGIKIALNDIHLVNNCSILYISLFKTDK